MQNKILKFKHYYYKLIEDFFSTIRGKTSFNKFEIGDIVDVYIENQLYFKAILIDKEIQKIDNLELEFLKKDGEYKGLVINTKQHFLDLINSFNPPFYKLANLESEKTIFYFKKI